MNRQSVSQIMLWGCVLLLCGCAAPQKQVGEKASVMESNRQEEKQKASAADLKQLYQAAKSESERRAVCLRAIDEGLIHSGVHISLIDEVFDTHFAEKLPTGQVPSQGAAVNFAPQAPSTPKSDGGVMQASDYVGWYLALQYDQQGNVLKYYLSNVHKSPGASIPESRQQQLIAELKRLYDVAKSESERRAVCLRAIDEGIIRNGGHISSVDKIFGTHFANDLPTRKEGTRNSSVDLSRSAVGPDKSTDTAQAGWFLSVEYGDDGSLYNYFLTNINK
jgi:hypothetical protein